MNKRARALDDKLATVTFHVDKESHIKLKRDLCLDCRQRPCLFICPAGNYEWDEDANQLIFNHEGCLECGSCRLVCDAIEWSYPRGGFGVSYQWG